MRIRYVLTSALAAIAVTTGAFVVGLSRSNAAVAADKKEEPCVAFRTDTNDLKNDINGFYADGYEFKAVTGLHEEGRGGALPVALVMCKKGR
jgi:hypothetical protein